MGVKPESLWNEPYHVIIEIENRRCRLLNILKNQGIKQFDIVDIRGVRENLTRHLIKLQPQHLEKLPKNLTTKTSTYRGKAFLWVESEGCDVCNTILSNNSFLVSGRMLHDNIFVYNFIASSFDSYMRILSMLEEKNLRPSVLKVAKLRHQLKILTEKQERVLWLALKTGLFDYPKKISLEELSRKLGISSSTLSETMRRGIRRLLEYYFKS